MPPADALRITLEAAGKVERRRLFGRAALYSNFARPQNAARHTVVAGASEE